MASHGGFHATGSTSAVNRRRSVGASELEHDDEWLPKLHARVRRHSDAEVSMLDADTKSKLAATIDVEALRAAVHAVDIGSTDNKASNGLMKVGPGRAWGVGSERDALTSCVSIVADWRSGGCRVRR